MAFVVPGVSCSIWQQRNSKLSGSDGSFCPSKQQCFCVGRLQVSPATNRCGQYVQCSRQPSMMVQDRVCTVIVHSMLLLSHFLSTIFKFVSFIVRPTLSNISSLASQIVFSLRCCVDSLVNSRGYTRFSVDIGNMNVCSAF